MVDAAVQRRNMVESQVRPSDVTDRRIIAAMLDIPREAFVPQPIASLAYSDVEIPLSRPAHGGAPRALLAPRVFAKLVDLARIGPRHVVLDVGAASGYSAAVLGKLAETVVALECDAGLAASAGAALTSLSFDNVAVVQGDLAAGWPSAGPYDAIVVEGMVGELPPALIAQLTDGGRLVAIVEDQVGTAVVVQRRNSGFDRRAAFDATGPRLPGFERTKAFSL